MCDRIRAFREHGQGRTKSSSENKPFFRCDRRQVGRGTSGQEAALSEMCHRSPAPTSDNCRAVTSLGLFHLFSKMSVWEQTEKERVFHLPISHVPLVTAFVCNVCERMWPVI